MRTIKFRGQRFDNKEWVCGGYFTEPEEDALIHYIFTFENGAIPVFKESVGEFTGQTVNGEDLYEGDLVRVFSGKDWHSFFDYTLEIKFGDFNKGHDSYSNTKGFGAYKSILGNTHLHSGLAFLKEDYGYDTPNDAKVRFKIIGNIHENKK